MAGSHGTILGGFGVEFRAACWSVTEIPTPGAAGIGILAFRLLDPVPLSAGREFHKIVTRFYFYNST